MTTTCGDPTTMVAVIGGGCEPINPFVCHLCGDPNPKHLKEYKGCGCILPTCCGCSHDESGKEIHDA